MYIITIIAIALYLPFFNGIHAATSSSKSAKPSLDPHTGTMELTLRNYQRFETPLNPYASPNRLELRSKGKGRIKGNIDYQYHLKLLYDPNNSHFFQSLSELNIGSSHENGTWTLGRKILHWNPIETFWGLGELNGVDGISPVNPEHEGLIGFHMKRPMGTFTAELFASYIYLPVMNPGYSLTDDKIILGKNEWGIFPPTSANIEQGQAPLRYSIDYPGTKEVFDIITNGSIGLSLSHPYKIDSVTGNLRLYAIYKPENRLRTIARSTYRLDSSSNHFHSLLTYGVRHHTLFGLGASQKIGSITWDFHLSHNHSEGLSTPPSPDSDFFELHGYYYDTTTTTNSLSYQNGPWQMGLHHLSIHQPDMYRLPLNVLSKKSLWHEALGLSLEYRNRYAWNGLLDVKYDTQLSNTVIKSRLSYTFTSDLSLGTQLEIIQCPRPGATNYWSKLRTNDTLQTYLSYRF